MKIKHVSYCQKEYATKTKQTKKMEQTSEEVTEKIVETYEL
jgi:hypothetical protein